ncbi:DUF4388 domain-containing protein [Deinococcus budaensis]|uniref:DUF4388 domain-containing protein n=1 Tax=Deinococcus budaensis TaxID=1665626 RepID=A0A7W8GHS2_9DEIO|nr:DUF4388 domain-containing protein [Deinococcus budaensis]MBB5235877.1 hypothetical protein [Deinococcus budaensis]
MALFGDLEHHALSDLVRVLASQTGTLYFHEAYQGRTLELGLQAGRLRAMYLDGFPVETPEQARAVLREVQSARRGAFEFQRRVTPAASPTLYDLPLTELLQDAAIPADQWPHPDTRFEVVPGPGVVPSALSDAWSVLQPQLLAGASGAELARRVGWAEADVLLALHRLRAAGAVAPQRAAPAPAGLAVSALSTGHEAGAAMAPSSSASGASAPLVQRLLGALRRLTGARA